MQTLPSFISMEKDPDEMKADMPMTPGDQPIYPYGLSICLCDDELSKLDMEGDCEVGDLLHFAALAKVTSVTKNDTSDGPKTRVELQIIGMATEDNDDEEPKPARISPEKMYK